MTWGEHPRLQDMAAPGAHRAAPRVSNSEKMTGKWDKTGEENNKKA